VHLRRRESHAVVSTIVSIMSSIRFWMAGLARPPWYALRLHSQNRMSEGGRPSRIDIVSGLAGLVELLAEGCLNPERRLWDHLGTMATRFLPATPPRYPIDGHVHAFEAFRGIPSRRSCSVMERMLSLASNHPM